jgi:hypothetical protein
MWNKMKIIIIVMINNVCVKVIMKMIEMKCMKMISNNNVMKH